MRRGAGGLLEMAGGNLTVAVRRGALVDDLERCAPPVCAPYLQAAYQRMRLPISVSFDSFYSCDRFPFAIITDDGWCRVASDEREAARIYFQVCETFPSAAPDVSRVPAVAPGADSPSVSGASFSPRPIA